MPDKKSSQTLLLYNCFGVSKYIFCPQMDVWVFCMGFTTWAVIFNKNFSAFLMGPLKWGVSFVFGFVLVFSQKFRYHKQ